MASNNLEYAKRYRKKNAAKLRATRQRPRGRYDAHKSHAKARGIEWRFTFEEWWKIWEPHWHQRGRGRDDLQMCRLRDQGPYSPDNVRIDRCRNNSLEMIATHGPPIQKRSNPVAYEAREIRSLGMKLAEKDAKIAKAERLLTELAVAGVDKLTELAPDAGWDSGEKVAEMYIRRLRA